MTVKPIPDGYHTITPFIVAKDTKLLLEFLQKAFDAKVIFNMVHENGSSRHAEIQIGNSKIMLSEELENYPATPVILYLYVKDTDLIYKKAMDAGATSLLPPTDMYYGDRNSGIKDLSGNSWWIATHKEDLSPDEIIRRAKNHNTINKK